MFAIFASAMMLSHNFSSNSNSRKETETWERTQSTVHLSANNLSYEPHNDLVTTKLTISNDYPKQRRRRPRRLVHVHLPVRFSRRENEGNAVEDKSVGDLVSSGKGRNVGGYSQPDPSCRQTCDDGGVNREHGSEWKVAYGCR